MVGPRELFACEVVDLARDSFSESATVGEHDGRVVLVDELQQSRVHRRPDRTGRVAVVIGDVVSGSGHVANRHLYVEVQRGLAGGVDDLHRSGSPVVSVDRSSAQEPGDRGQGPLGGGQSDALRRFVSQLLQAFEGNRQVSPALRTRHRMDLVDDDSPNR